MSSASLKLECLVQDSCTLPGSILLKDKPLATMVQNNEELLKAGILRPDLRSSVSSFSELSAIIDDSYDREFAARYSSFLDKAVSKPIAFDANENTSVYKNSMLAFLRRRAQRSRIPRIQEKLSQLVEIVDGHTESFSYEIASKLKTGHSSTDREILLASKYFYCISGAEFIGGIAQIPEPILRGIKSVPRIETNSFGGKDSRMLSYAHEAVMDYFGIKIDVLDRLTDRDIIQLRSDGATQNAIKQLRNEVSLASKTFSENTGTFGHFSDLKEARKELASRIAEYCERQARRSSRAELGAIGAEDIVEYGAERLVDDALPFANTLKSSVLWTGRKLSRINPKLKRMDISIYPMHTYIRRLQDRISGRPPKYD